jgi:hypothetical protein
MADSGNSKGWRRVGRHYSLLLWKNFILARRTPIRTTLEIILPVFFGFLLLAIRHIVKSEAHPNSTIYHSYSFDALPPFNDGIPPSFIAFAPNTTFSYAVMTRAAESLTAYSPDQPIYGKLFQNKSKIRFTIMYCLLSITFSG